MFFQDSKFDYKTLLQNLPKMTSAQLQIKICYVKLVIQFPYAVLRTV